MRNFVKGITLKTARKPSWKTNNQPPAVVLIMKMLLYESLVVVLAFFGVSRTFAQGEQFFRISGPGASKLVALEHNGNLIWSNAQNGVIYTVQTASSLSGAINWMDYVQILATQNVETNQVVSFNPPAGTVLVPTGIFTMGDTLDGETDAIPTSVTVSGFYMDANLVSYSQWQTIYAYATNHGYGFVNPGAGKAAINRCNQLIGMMR